MHDLQTHALPTANEEPQRLRSGMGYQAESREEGGDGTVLADRQRHTAVVHHTFRSLFYHPETSDLCRGGCGGRPSRRHPSRLERDRDPAGPPPTGLHSEEETETLVHAFHAVVVTSMATGRLFFSSGNSDHDFGRQHQARDAGGVLQMAQRDTLVGSDDTHLDHIHVLVGGGVVAAVRDSCPHGRGDHHGTFGSRVGGDLTKPALRASGARCPRRLSAPGAGPEGIQAPRQRR